MATPYKMRIDIVSDVVCPWCIIGYKQLENALEMVGDEVDAEIVWQPFELNPHMPPEGQDMVEHITQKYGTTAEQGAKNRGHIASMGEKLGFRFSDAPDRRIYNTFKAHQLLHWAGDSFGSGLQTRLKLALFAAYFQDNQDVSDEHVLLSVVESTGMDAEAARAVLNDPAHAERTRAVLNSWVERGVSGVPATILEGKYMVPGAQDAETFAQMIRKVVAKEAA